MDKNETAVDLLEQVIVLLEEDKKWDGSMYTYGLVYPHKYIALLAKIKDYVNRNESLE